jgi:dihydrolipoamide dehydrogenase
LPSGIVVQESFGAIESFEKTPTGVQMNFTKDGHRGIAKATLAVVAVGWIADTSSEHLR